MHHRLKLMLTAITFCVIGTGLWAGTPITNTMPYGPETFEQIPVDTVLLADGVNVGNEYGWYALGDPGEVFAQIVSNQWSSAYTWDHARSASEILAHKDYRLTGLEGGLLGYWPLNEGSGTRVFDGSANANTGTVVNADWVVASDLDLPPLMAADRYVAQGTNVPDGSYQSWATAASNIHDAVGVAVSGETVWVGPGTYRRAGVASVVDIAKSIHLRGAEGPEHTIIDGENARRGLFIDARTLVDADILIEGLTIANGQTAAYGGGIYFMHTGATGTGVIENCIITNCEITAEGVYYGGGGVYIYGSTHHSTAFLAVVRDCTISDNRIPGRLGGAGLATRDSLVLVEDCRILNNRITVGANSGGGIYMHTPVAGSIVRNSLIAGNIAGDGGGVRVGGGVLIDRCIIRDNLATRFGGGVFPDGTTASTVRNCLVYNNRSGNRGSGITARSAAGFILENTTVTSNRNTTVGGWGSSGVLLENATATSYIRNSIIDQNYTAAGGHVNFVRANSVDPVITNSLITAYAALPPGWGNLSVPPEFIDFNAQNFRISRSSPCIDAGFQQAWMTGARDLDGRPRIFGEAVDMGCYEYHPTGTIISVR